LRRDVTKPFGHAPPSASNGSANPAFAEELQLIIAGEQPLDTMLTQVAELAKRLLPIPIEASVTLITGDGPATVAFTGQVAFDLDETQYDYGYGPCVDAAQAHHVASIPDTRTEDKWPSFIAAAVERGVRSCLSVPMPVQSPAIAALNMYSDEYDAFDAESITLATTIAEYGAIAVANTLRGMDRDALARQMADAMANRSTIEQAKGILMARHRCGPETAFDLLVADSQQTHRKLRDVAAALVDQTARP
jgi:GAF domain-containing protein